MSYYNKDAFYTKSLVDPGFLNINKKRENYFYKIILFIALILIIYLPMLLLKIFQNPGYASFYGFEFIPVYFLFLSLVVFAFLSFFALNERLILFLTFLLYKMPMFFLLIYMTKMKFGFYGAGPDFNGYYNLALGFYDKNFLFMNTWFAAKFSAFLLNLFPLSYFGIAMLNTTMSFIAYLIFYLLLEKQIDSRDRIKLFLIFFIIPSLMYEAGYVGKDSIMIFLISLVFLITNMIINHKLSIPTKMIGIIAIAFLIFIIYQVRSYQAVFMITTYLVFFAYILIIKRKSSKLKIATFFSILFSFGYLAVLLYSKIAVNALFGAHEGIESLMSSVYANGNTMLKPFPFPFFILQIFRPFPWEHPGSLILFGTSIEMFLIIIYLFYLIIKRWYKLFGNFENLFYVFVFIYTLVNVMIFSFDPNLGDLGRRSIYYLPFVLSLILAWNNNKSFTHTYDDVVKKDHRRFVLHQK